MIELDYMKKKQLIYTIKIKKAIDFASKVHKDQKRIVLGYPYISHPLSVLFLVSHFSDDEDTLSTAILHDTVEDTDVTLNNIEVAFGKIVRNMVDVLTEDSSLLEIKDKKQKQLDKLKNANRNVILVKSADIIHNFCDIILVLENYPKETYLKFFGGGIKEKINMAEKRIKIIEESWRDNPLLSEVKSCFKDYKKMLEKLELLKL